MGFKKGLKACLQWKVYLTYAASLQAIHSDNSETKNSNTT